MIELRGTVAQSVQRGTCEQKWAANKTEIRLQCFNSDTHVDWFANANIYGEVRIYCYDFWAYYITWYGCSSRCIDSTPTYECHSFSLSHQHNTSIRSKTACFSKAYNITAAHLTTCKTTCNTFTFQKLFQNLWPLLHRKFDYIYCIICSKFITILQWVALG